ncbi:MULTISPECIES: SDR family oxidoreductase [unclassified Frondihabitans]|uniref:SDR family oxidoreductase n=1 Tax=unclassified Frondihabitans TaxID=2626248 RepID=UPI000F4D71E2|nr:MULTISPECIES: SDR family oxidoreductase [unclassified Frondihabitans]RPE76521.1 NAD(P)H dehydrogenase (quinone) [Frondihabitans sp. PhB153]RPF05204.1 NAD(P)H dehydrogenase (quinone) [Frondihabitans sp. PhB161]
MSYIVTAASGQLGALIVDALLARGAEPSSIVATARDTTKIASLADRGVTTAALDYSKPETIAAALGAGDVVVLVSSDAVGQRVPQHTAVIDAAKAAGVARIVYTSAPHADDTTLILAPEHKATEEHLRASGVPFTILRNGWYTENYTGEVGKARQSGEITASVGDGRVASASRKDYAEAAAVALLDDTTAGKTFELSGDYAWHFSELAEAIADIVGSPVSYRALTPEEHAEQLAGFGLDEGTVGFVVALDGNIRDGLLAETSGDLARLIGRPTTPLAEGLAAAQ